MSGHPTPEAAQFTGVMNGFPYAEIEAERDALREEVKRLYQLPRDVDQMAANALHRESQALGLSETMLEHYANVVASLGMLSLNATGELRAAMREDVDKHRDLIEAFRAQLEQIKTAEVAT